MTGNRALMMVVVVLAFPLGIALQAVVIVWFYSRGRPFAAVCAGLFVLGLSVHLLLLLRSILISAAISSLPSPWAA